MSEVIITKLNNGPFLVKGSIQLLDSQGNLYETKDQTYLCRCGQSKNAPFCNGAHKASGYVEESQVKTAE